MRTRRGLLTAIATAASLVVAGCAQANGPYPVRVAPELHPRLAPEDAVAISRAYLDAQTPQIVARELHIAPTITAVWAVRAADAAALDGCIPAHPGETIVWVTKGRGDYLNLTDHAWSRSSFHAGADEGAMSCEYPGPEGTLVVDDATGALLGVYPGSPLAPHPSP